MRGYDTVQLKINAEKEFDENFLLQGINVIFTDDEHYIGRLVPDKHFVIESNSVSANHCKIYRKRDFDKDVHGLSYLHVPVFIKDTRFLFFLEVYFYPICVSYELIMYSFMQHEWYVSQLGKID